MKSYLTIALFAMLALAVYGAAVEVFIKVFFLLLYKMVSISSSSDGCQSSSSTSSNEKITFLTACVFIVGEVAGGGMLSLPHATAQSGWYGIGLIIYCALASAIGGICLAECWLILEERYPQYRHGLTRKPFATIGYHSFGKYSSALVSILINVTRIGSGTVFFLLTSSLIQSITKSFINITQCHWILIVPLVCFFPYLLGSPGDFWPIAYLATGSSVIGSVLLMITLVIQIAKNGVSDDFHIESMESFTTSYGVILFAYSGAASFPNFQNDMKEKEKFPRAVMFGYVALVLIYVPVAALGYATEGANVSTNIIDHLSNGVMVTIVRCCFLAHCMAVIFITTNPVLLDLEELFRVPKQFGWKRVLLRTCILLLMTFLALTFPNFGEVLDLIGSTTIVLLSFILPLVFYIKLCYDSKKNKTWPNRNLSYPLLATFAIVIISTIIAGIASTYSTLKHFTSLKSACYLSNWN
ncbi:hypothetical protein RDWZM_006242, partial [Blomia tropicalis]